MVYQTGFRPAGSVLGAKVVSVASSFPSFIEPFPVYSAPAYPSVYPSAYAVTAPEVVPPATPSSGYGSTVTLLAAGGIALAGVALLISALGPKR